MPIQIQVAGVWPYWAQYNSLVVSQVLFDMHSSFIDLIVSMWKKCGY